MSKQSTALFLRARGVEVLPGDSWGPGGSILTVSHRALSPKQFLHGTSADLKEGQVIIPGGIMGKRKTSFSGLRSKRVYVTTSPSSAESYSKQAVRAHGGEARVYEVEPHHPSLEPDPETAGMKGYESEMRTRHARVIRRVS